MIKIIPTWVWLAAIGLAFLLGGFLGYSNGKDNVQDKWNKSIERGAKIVADLKEKANKVTIRTETKYLTIEKEVFVKGDTITKYVKEYLPSGTGCVDSGNLSGTFRVLHDAAVESRIPDTANFANAASVPVTEAASTVAENYTACKANAEKVIAWQEWAKEQCKLNEKGCP